MRARNVLEILLGLFSMVNISLLSFSAFGQTPQRQPRRLQDFKPSPFDCHSVTQRTTDPVSSRLSQKSGNIDVTSDKNDIVEYLKLSTEFCKQAFSKLNDAKLAESIPWRGLDSNDLEGVGPTVTRFAAALWVTDTLIERYGAIASYMQTHGTLSDPATLPLVTGIRNPALGR
jgi:hypothetical protein